MGSNNVSHQFLYFAFGSNLLTERIHLNNPSAQKVGIGKLQGYKLDFGNYSSTWKGATATIVQCNDSHVYGILWNLDIEDKKHLDKQEGIELGIYRPLEVEVETTEGELVTARTYQLIQKTPSNGDKRPSFPYYSVILKGAKEHGLPQEYIKQLEQIDDNGYRGSVDVGVKLHPDSAP